MSLLEADHRPLKATAGEVLAHSVLERYHRLVRGPSCTLEPAAALAQDIERAS
jgi:hypothetical protein